MKKRFWLSYILSWLLLTTFGVLLLWLLNPQKELVISSPLPQFLTSFVNKQVTTLTLWKPALQSVLSGAIEKPQIQAKEALLYDLTAEKVIFEKNVSEKRPIASLTKVMTAVIALENQRSDNRYRVSAQALVGENVMGLTEGEILTLEELLYGLILPSGNDAAEVLAENFPGGRVSFIQAMNNKAKALGLSDTNFTNPSGLQGDGNQYSTAYDLLVITKYALERFPLFRKVVATYEHTIPYSENHKAFVLYNETNLLTSYPGVKGIKTGYTFEADLCLITYLDYKGNEFIGVILGSNNRREEMKQLLDYGLKLNGTPPPPHG